MVRRKDFHPARVTICIAVCIPNELGYYAHRFDVLKLSLRSLFANTPAGTYELMVLDNRSCPPVVEYLQNLKDRGLIDYLVLLKRNIGKIPACRMMCEAAPGDLVAYGDEDVFYESGWLDAQLELVDAFPRVGMVSARPVRKQFAYGNRYLKKYLEEFPDITAAHGHFIPDDWEREYLYSTGRSASGVEQLKETTSDILLERQGVKAYSTASHFQFLAPKPVMLEGLRRGALRSTGGEERKIEEAIDELAYARLSTTGRFVRHIGNVVSAALLQDVDTSGIVIDDLTRWTPPSSLASRLALGRAAQIVLWRLNRWSYQLLNLPEP